MGYKTKSMIKQLSGLSAEYYLDKELNKYTNKISEKPKQGESIANSSKKFTPFKIFKSKDSARDREEKKQIRKAGREAARNTDVDFVKATPMGSDYFSLMAATAENLASRGAGKRKARKAAKDLKREKLSEDRDVKPTDIKGFKKITKDESKDKLEDTKRPINVDMPDMTDYIESKTEKAQYDYDQEKKLKLEQEKMLKLENEAKLNTTPPGISGIGRTEIPIATPPFPISTEQQEQDSEYVQQKIDEDIKEQFKGTGLESLFMMGDGFNKGMLRKNKYKK